MIKARRRDTGPTDAVKKIVRARFGYRCVRCGHDGETIQHRVPRGMGGSSRPEINQPQNLVFVCGDGTTKCHGRMESYRDEARAAGWLVHRSLDPREVAVLLWDGRRVLLDDEGGYEVVAEGGEAA